MNNINRTECKKCGNFISDIDKINAVNKKKNPSETIMLLFAIIGFGTFRMLISEKRIDITSIVIIVISLVIAGISFLIRKKYIDLKNKISKNGRKNIE